MLSITCQEMKDMDSYSIKDLGIPSIVLMERASLQVLKNIDLDETNSFTIICGTGNNGGDGLALARHLLLANKDLDLFIIGSIEKLTVDSRTNLDILENLGLEPIGLTGQDDLEALTQSISSTDMTIDSIFGIGLTRNLEGIFYRVIELINSHSKNTLAIDIPSGLDGDTGQVLGIATQADKTISFHMAKVGLINRPEFTGQLIVEDIGIPKLATDYVLKKNI